MLYVVVQQGGSSFEWYTSFYDTVEEAVAAINSHREASYDAIGPFELAGEFTNAQLAALTEVFDDVAGYAVDRNSSGSFLNALHQQKFKGIHDR